MIFALFNLKLIKLYHLDIKPLNILITKNNEYYIFKLSDFGEAK